MPLYTEVLYRDLYPNIDLRFYDDGAGLRYDFIVNPGGNPADIMLAYKGIENLSLDGSELVATTAVGDIRQSRPVIYQGSEGRRIEVEGGFLLADENSYGFRIAGYNPAQTLIIDPSISYSSYFGGTGADYCYSVAVDGTYAYFTGYTNSTEASFPVKTGSYDITHNGGNDAFVAKINTASSGASSLIYCTYLGGSGDDEGIDIAVLDGETYITGRTKSDDFPTYNTTFYGSYHYNYDIFVTRLNAAGSGLLCSVYIGGQDIDYGESIYVSSADYVLIAGTTWSADITVSSAYQSTQQGNGDAYICKMDMTNGTHMWGSYFGGSGSDWGQDVTLSANSCPVLVGYTPGTDFPARTTGAYQTAYGGGNSDVFVVRFNASPAAEYSTTRIWAAVAAIIPWQSQGGQPTQRFT